MAQTDRRRHPADRWIAAEGDTCFEEEEVKEKGDVEAWVYGNATQTDNMG